MPKSVNPATGETVKEMAGHSDADVVAAIDAADDAFQAWRTRSFGERAALMRKVADLLDARRDQLAQLATIEMGKRIAEARAEVEKSALACRYYADHAEAMLADDDRPSSASKSFVRYQPLGAVLAVMPWNFPYWQVFRFAAPTLMAGNTGLLKHASNVPQCAMAIEELFRDAGFPAGVFTTLLIGSGQVDAMIADDRVKAVTLTGSEGAGRAVGAAAGQQIKPSLLELGGSDPFIVMPSADLDKAAETAVTARLINNGQSCIAAKRFIVHKDVYQRFADRMAARFSAMTTGNPMDEATDVGPLSSQEAVETIAEQVDALREAGAIIKVGGDAPDGAGAFFPPTLVTDIPAGAKEREDEIFGPVAMLFEVSSVDEAISIANETPFGLGSSVWTQDQAEIERFANGVEAGAVFVNQMVASDPRLPFGGIKTSGYGRELSREGILAFVNAKTVVIA